MPKIILDKTQVQELIFNNRYKVNAEKKFVSRCIDGRYENSSDLPALAIAGADLGEVAVIVSAGNDFGFSVDLQKTVDVLIDIVGGVKNFNFHTDSHADAKIPAAGCGHIKQVSVDNNAYKLTEEQVESLGKIAVNLKKKGANEIVLHGDHQEGAVFLVTGYYGVMPQGEVDVEGSMLKVQTFVFHKTLVDERHKVLAKKLIEKKAVELLNGLDDQYLYQAISEVTETHLFETVKRLAKGLPIYEVRFKDDGGFEVKEVGVVE